MILPLFGFLLMLAVVAGLVSLIAAADPHAAKFAPLVYPVSSAGLGVLGFIFVISFFGNFLSPDASGLITLIGSPIVILGGAFLGYRAGIERREKAESQLQLERQKEEESL